MLIPSKGIPGKWAPEIHFQFLYTLQKQPLNGITFLFKEDFIILNIQIVAHHSSL